MTRRVDWARISWGAVIAGALVALTCHFTLSLLGLAIGFSTIDPAREGGAGIAGFGTGAAWWWVVTSLVALFLGGWVAGRMAGALRGLGGALHGLVTWSLMTVLTLVMVGSGIGSVIGGLFGAIGEGVSVVQQAVTTEEASAPEADGKQGVTIDEALDRVVREAREVLEATEVPELQPERLEERAESTRGEMEEHLRAALTDPQQADRELRAAMDLVWGEAKEVASAADEEALISALASETDLSREEARRAVEGWAQTLEQARQEAQRLGEQVIEAAEEGAGEAADALAWASLWAFVGLLVGAACAMLGGFLGAPRIAS